MKGFLPVFKRELLSFFVTPVAWVTITAFLLIEGLYFYYVVSHFAAQPGLAVQTGPVEMFFGQSILAYLPLLLVCPVLTMRLFAEERRSGTIEPLLTAPVDAAAVVLGKYLAVLVAYCAMWLPTLLYCWLASQDGYVDWNVVGACYLAVLGVGAGYLAIGTLTSALTQSQLTAAIVSTMAIVGLFILGIGEFILPEGSGRELCAYVSVWSQMNDFSRGVVDSRRLIFDASVTIVPLFFTVRVVESWRTE